MKNLIFSTLETPKTLNEIFSAIGGADCSIYHLEFVLMQMQMTNLIVLKKGKYQLA